MSKVDFGTKKVYHCAMRRFFGKIENGMAKIEGDEFVHFKTVLRGKVGEDIIIYDGSEKVYMCKTVQMTKTQAVCEILDTKICEGLPKKNIVLFQALAKKDKMELILQKAVELGVSEIIPFESEFCTVKNSENKKDRLEKIVISACKQCERSVPMKVEETLSFEKFVERLKSFKKLDSNIILFANERAGENFDFSKLKSIVNIAIVVGTEGGFSQKEKGCLEKICESISLGKRILRSESASIVLCGIASIIGEN